MPTKHINVQRFSMTSAKAFSDVIATFEAAIGHPDMNAFRKEIGATRTFSDLEEIVRRATGPSELMEFARFDLGEVLRNKPGTEARKAMRFVVGNPVIMSRMVEHVPDAGSYAPVTILIDERADGVHLSYDTMASYLATYGNQEALKVAQYLDSKVEALLTAAAS